MTYAEYGEHYANYGDYWFFSRIWAAPGESGSPLIDENSGYVVGVYAEWMCDLSTDASFCLRSAGVADAFLGPTFLHPLLQATINEYYGPNPVYVDPGYSTTLKNTGLPSGHILNPVSSVSEGLSLVASGGTLVLPPGSVSGTLDIDKDMTLVVPYGTLVLDDIDIQPGATLTITSGTHIELRSYKNIDVWGSLEIDGAANRRVVLSAAGTDWGGIRFYPGSTGDIQHTDMLGIGGIYGGSAIQITSANVDIYNSTIATSSSGYINGVTISGSTPYASVNITSSEIDHSLPGPDGLE